MTAITTIRVRFAETDALGHVNNVSFFLYMEEARVNFLKGLGFNFNSQEKFVALVSASCDYKNQAFFDQEIDIYTYVDRMGTKSFTLTQELTDHNTGLPIAIGRAVCVFLSSEKDQAVPIDTVWKEKLVAHTKSERSMFSK